VPVTGLASPGYRKTVRAGMTLLAVGAPLAALRSRRASPGRELATDAWLTLALVAAMSPAADRAIWLSCSALVTCSG